MNQFQSNSVQKLEENSDFPQEPITQKWLQPELELNLAPSFRKAVLSLAADNQEESDRPDLEQVTFDTERTHKSIKLSGTHIDAATSLSPSLSERIADRFVSTIGSWKFVTVQSTLLLSWVIVNQSIRQGAWDPYPFIFLNLLLSLQSAYAAPIIMISQNRQAERERQSAEADRELTRKNALALKRIEAKLAALEGDPREPYDSRKQAA